MTNFNMLSKNIQKRIWEFGWDSLSDIQEAAIPVILTEDKDVIITAGTASGKTEAAFLPIISKTEAELSTKLKVIYVAPLKALINNQFERLEELCNGLCINITKWHGDASFAKKSRLLENTNGILQITPESIEGIFLYKQDFIRKLFSNIEFIVLDELHSFLGNNRGVHLRSLLHRIEHVCTIRPKNIGLSATIDNLSEVKQWVNPRHPENVSIIDIKSTSKIAKCNIMYFESNSNGKPAELAYDIWELTKANKSIIFCNSRKEVEELSIQLNSIAATEGVANNYLTYHSSIDKSERESIEFEINKKGTTKSIISSSSLEMGVDIGGVILVCQVESPSSVSSLKQRSGRAGRRKECIQYLQMYATSIDSLLLSIATYELSLAGWVEPASFNTLPYDILFHQILSICKEAGGISHQHLLQKIAGIAVFDKLNRDSINLLLEHMMQNCHIELISGLNEYVLGVTGEKIVHERDFCSVFITCDEYSVRFENQNIGKIDKTFNLNQGDNIILGGRSWRITSINNSSNVVFVEPASSGKTPTFQGGKTDIHPHVIEKIINILCESDEYPYLDDSALYILRKLREKHQDINQTKNQRIIWTLEEISLFESYLGGKQLLTLQLMLRKMGVKIEYVDRLGRIGVPSSVDLDHMFVEIQNEKWNCAELLSYVKPYETLKSKFLCHLPDEIISEMNSNELIDINGVLSFFNNHEFVTSVCSAR